MNIQSKIINYVKNLNKKTLRLDNIKNIKVKKLGMGASNLNYLLSINNKKFIFRFNVDPLEPNKSKKEFKALKIVENLDIAPKAYFYDDSKKEFDMSFIVIEYIEGKTLNQINYSLSQKSIKEIVKILSKLHNIRLTKNIKKLPAKMNDYKSYLNFINKEISYVGKNVKDKNLYNILIESNKKLKENYKENKKFNLVIGQNDFMQDNLVINKNKYTLIDFEDLCLVSREAEIARILIDFGKEFNKKQREIFLKEYLKNNHVNDKSKFKEEINNFIPLIILSALLWSISHILRIKNKEFHDKFIKNNNLEADIKHAVNMFNRAIKYNIINPKYKDLNLRKQLK